MKKLPDLRFPWHSTRVPSSPITLRGLHTMALLPSVKQHLVRGAVMLCMLFVCSVAFAQAAPAPTSGVTAQQIEHWFLVASAIGTGLSTFLAVVAAQLPQLTWLSKIAAVLGALPIVDMHGLTTGTMQVRMHAAVQAAKTSAALPQDVAAAVIPPPPLVPPPPADTKK